VIKHAEGRALKYHRIVDSALNHNKLINDPIYLLINHINM